MYTQAHGYEPGMHHTTPHDAVETVPKITTASVGNDKLTAIKGVLLDNTGQVGPTMDSNAQKHSNQSILLVSCSAKTSQRTAVYLYSFQNSKLNIPSFSTAFSTLPYV